LPPRRHRASSLLFGLQAAINMMVNVHLMPAKGMTLPFVSYGGSSLFSLALGMGFLIALTRRRPAREMLGRAPRAAPPTRCRHDAPLVLLSAGGHRRAPVPGRGPARRCWRARRRVALATDERVGGRCPAPSRPRRWSIPSATPSVRSVPQMARPRCRSGPGRSRRLRRSAA
jgi:hypothetical protein